MEEERDLSKYPVDILDLTPEEQQEAITPDIIVDVDEILARTTQQHPVEPKALIVADFARRTAEELSALDTAYDMKLGRQEESPFDGEPPYMMDSAMFVYWAFREADINLGDPLTFNMQKLKRVTQLREVATAGSGLGVDKLIPGDVIFFFPQSRHAGIYIGNKSFVAFNGTGTENYNGGAEKKRIDKGYWKDHFYGHVLRYDTTTLETARPM